MQLVSSVVPLLLAQFSFGKIRNNASEPTLRFVAYTRMRTKALVQKETFALARMDLPAESISHITRSPTMVRWLWR